MKKMMLFAVLCALSSVSPMFAATHPEAHEEKPASGVVRADAVYTNSLGMELVRIPAGSFLSDKANVGGFGDRLKITVTKPFYLGKHQVTQAQWAEVMENNPSEFKGLTHPVEKVSWHDTQEFISRLNHGEGHNLCRLPTESEWELASRGGGDAVFSFINNMTSRQETETHLDDHAWYNKNSGGTTHPVGQKKANPYGLYDMHGNVWEWVQDRYADLPTNQPEIVDYRGPARGSDRVILGGGWDCNAEFCNSGNRNHSTPENRLNFIGFRLACSAE